MSVKIEVWGDYACFSIPSLKVERVTYDVMTPSAARGIIEAVYWHPGLRWKIDRIYVLSPIKTTSIMRNELKSKISARNAKTAMTGGKGDLYLSASSDRNQRTSTVLVDVHYVIEAHFEMTPNANPSDNPGKFQDIIRRRLHRGQCFHNPYLGCREFSAKFREYEGNEIKTIDLTDDLGYMLYDMNYENPEDIRPQFFRAKIKNGVLDLTDCEVIM